MGKIKNLIFDMGGVLVDLDRDACAEAFRRLGYAEAYELLNNYAPQGVFRQLEIGAISPDEFHTRIQSHVGTQLAPQRIDGALLKFLCGLPGYKLDMLAELRKRFKIYMLSNTNPIMMRYIRREYFTQRGLTFEDYFDRAFLSFEMGAMKPDEDIYFQMIASSGMVPTESLFIDDGPANVETARRLGFETYLAAPQEDFRHIFEGI